MKKGENNYRNFIEYPIILPKAKNRNCCGYMAATGDEAAEAAPVPAKTVVNKVTVIGYAKTGLAILGLYVAVTWLWKKYGK